MGIINKIIAILRSLVIIKKYNDGTFSYYLRVPIKIKSRHLLAFKYGEKSVVANKIVFDNYMGKGFGCNPKYVALKLEELYPGKYEMVWITSKENFNNSDIPDWIRKVDYESEKALEEYATAKVWVSNYHKIAFSAKGLYKKKNQFFIQMWHGSLGIKKIENDASVLTKDKKWLKQAKLSSSMVDYWISNSSFETDIYKRAFWGVNDEKILMYGHPRNDIFFRNNDKIEEKVRKYFNIYCYKLALFAPTFREDGRLDVYEVDYELLRESLSKRFGGDWAVLVRLHPRLRDYSKKLVVHKKLVFDASFYVDIQELLSVADCMITDYSSCIFDFMLSRKPGFIFAPDIDKYNTERGFYYPLEETPFQIATDNNHLSENVLTFNNEQYLKYVDEFMSEKGCADNGKASDNVVKLINRITVI